MMSIFYFKTGRFSLRAQFQVQVKLLFATMGSNVLGEIDAIKDRLKLAKKTADNADANLKLTKAAHDSAKAVCEATEAAYIAAMKQDKDAREDVKDAEASLNAKVVDISSEEEDDEGDFNGEVQDAFAVNGSLIEVDGANDGRENGSEKKRAAVLTGQSSSANKKARSDVDIFQVKSIEVSGCGTPEANDTYLKTGMYDDAPEFRRSGKWKGKDATFSIRRGEDVTWYISVVCVLGGSTLYYYDYEDDNDISPFNKV
jgi:hypothetical protein